MALSTLVFSKEKKATSRPWLCTRLFLNWINVLMWVEGFHVSTIHQHRVPSTTGDLFPDYTHLTTTAFIMILDHQSYNTKKNVQNKVLSKFSKSFIVILKKVFDEHIHMSFFGATGIGFLVMSPLGFKARVGSDLFAFFRGKCNVHSPRYTSGSTHADLLAASSTASHFPKSLQCTPSKSHVHYIIRYNLHLWVLKKIYLRNFFYLSGFFLWILVNKVPKLAAVKSNEMNLKSDK